MILLSKKIYVLLAVLLAGSLPSGLFAQVSFTATVTPSTIGKNETAELRFAIDNANKVERISPPNLKDFIVVSGPNQETGMESINGVTRRYVGVTYLVRPQKERAAAQKRLKPPAAKTNRRPLRSKRTSNNSIKKPSLQKVFFIESVTAKISTPVPLGG